MRIDFFLKNKDGTSKKKDWFSAIVLIVLVIVAAVVFARMNKVSSIKSIGFGFLFLMFILVFLTFAKAILDLDQGKTSIVNANANAITLFATYSALIDHVFAHHMSFSNALFISIGAGFVGAVVISSLSSVITDVVKDARLGPESSQNTGYKNRQVVINPDSSLFSLGLATVTAAIAIALSADVPVIVILMLIPPLFTVFRFFFSDRTNL